MSKKELDHNNDEMYFKDDSLQNIHQVDIVKEMKKSFAFIEATLSHEGQVCSQCDMIYFCFSQEKSASDFFFYGCELEEE